MIENKSIVDQLAEFHKIIDYLENIKAKIEDGDKAILMLRSLLISFEHFKDVIFYGPECTITWHVIQTTMRSKEFSKVRDFKIDDNGEDLSDLRGGSERRGISKSKGFDKSKVKCFTC